MYVVCLSFYAIGGFCLFLYFYLFTAFYAVGVSAPSLRPGEGTMFLTMLRHIHKWHRLVNLFDHSNRYMYGLHPIGHSQTNHALS